MEYPLGLLCYLASGSVHVNSRCCVGIFYQWKYPHHRISFNTAIENLKKCNKQTGKSGYETQFEVSSIVCVHH